MISTWARRDNWWMNIGSMDFVLKPELRGNLEIRRRESYDLSGLKKNNLSMLWESTSDLLRQEDTTSPGFVMWGCEDLSGGGSPAGIVQEVREGEAGGVSLAGRQSFLHETVCLLCRAEVPNDDGKRRCERTEAGLAYREDIGQGIHEQAASTKSCGCTWGNRHRRNILTERTHVSDYCQ